jgi:bacterioferritin (cytochrome b1)
VRAIEEMRHAEGLIERIIFLGSTPTLEVGLKLN